MSRETHATFSPTGAGAILRQDFSRRQAYG